MRQPGLDFGKRKKGKNWQTFEERVPHPLLLLPFFFLLLRIVLRAFRGRYGNYHNRGERRFRSAKMAVIYDWRERYVAN